MRRHFTVLLLSILVFGVINNSQSQGFNPYQNAYQGWKGDKIRKASPIRAFLNKFSMNVSLGYGRTFYKHQVNADVLETPQQLVMLGDYSVTGTDVNYSGVTNWLNYPTQVMGTASIDPASGNHILYADSADIRYGGSGFNIPVNVSLQLDIDRFRIGGGIMYELYGIKSLKPKGQGTYNYKPNFKSTTMFRYFFMLGGRFYSYKGWDYSLDVQIGKAKYSNKYDKSVLQNGWYFNVGVPMEYELSEYFWFFVRPSFDIKNYSLAITQVDAGGGTSTSAMQHNQPAFYLNFGVRMKLPEIRRCPIKSCHTQQKHVHGGREFRGQPFYKEQNPKIGELYRDLEQNKHIDHPKSKIKKHRN